jgi:hypothetical protein
MNKLTTLLLLSCLLLAGCSGVVLSARYSTLLNESAAISKAAADMADANQMTPFEMKCSLRWNAEAWRKFQDGRDGKAPTPATP